MIAIAFLFWISNAVRPENVTKVVKPYQTQVAKNFEEQYYEVVKNGTLSDVCVRALLVAEGYFQAADKENYAKWSAIRSKDCKAAGMPE